ncbi:hypothetical protein AVEN_58234-1 [Araneus ventricosus]|uniref:Pre-C2HC domain-containing protein n=1 Tax=Araneus ventricosus TaxID=182803 RepID=A0A4Y2JQH5_ARAVE|nr:hypothetical protein AVEN_58234-1 [Araneus ventricosus]
MNTKTILDDIHKVCGPTENKFGNGFIKVFPSSHDQHQEIQNFCKTQGYDFYIIPPIEKRPFKVVLKDLPPNMNTEDIKTFLINSDYPFIKVTQLTQLKTRRPLPFFLVDLVKNERAQKIYDSRQINRISITVEPYRGRNIAQQCFRCNLFHHNAANCQITPRCLKCNGSRQIYARLKKKFPSPLVSIPAKQDMLYLTGDAKNSPKGQQLSKIEQTTSNLIIETSLMLISTELGIMFRSPTP